MVTGQGHLSCCEEMLSRVGLISLGKRWLWGEPQSSLPVPTRRLARRWSQDLYGGGQWKDEKQ